MPKMARKGVTANDSEVRDSILEKTAGSPQTVHGALLWRSVAIYMKIIFCPFQIICHPCSKNSFWGQFIDCEKAYA